MKNILLYPIKLLLKRKVKRYRIQILLIDDALERCRVKSRRSGMQMSVSVRSFHLFYAKYPLEKFIEKWGLPPK